MTKNLKIALIALMCTIVVILLIELVFHVRLRRECLHFSDSRVEYNACYEEGPD